MQDQYKLTKMNKIRVKIDQVKEHIKENKRSYIIGGVCLIAGAVVIAVYMANNSNTISTEQDSNEKEPAMSQLFDFRLQRYLRMDELHKNPGDHERFSTCDEYDDYDENFPPIYGEG